MTYCAYAAVLAATNTTVAQATVETLIGQADAEINAWLSKEDLSAPASSTLLESASINLTVCKLIMRGRMDLSRPESLTVKGVSYTDGDQEMVIDALRSQAREYVDEYIRTVNNPDSASSEDFEQTVVRKDHKMPTLKLDQSTVHEYHEDADDTGDQDSNQDDV